MLTSPAPMRAFLALALIFLMIPMAWAATLTQVVPPSQTNTGKKPVLDLENTLYLDIPFGRVVIAMRPDLAPNHVKRIKELVRQHFYDNVPFHRVIAGFMAQTGDPTGTGTGGSGQKLKAEFSSEKHTRGTVSMARTNDPNSADSQFFICLADVPHLDGQYTVWGKVVSGMEAIDQIRKGESFADGVVNDPIRVSSLRVASDVERQGNLSKEARDAQFR